MKRKFFRRLAFLLLMVVQLAISVAASDGIAMTIALLTPETEQPIPNEIVHLCQVTKIDGGHQLTDDFKDSTLALDALFSKNANQYAPQIRDYVLENQISTVYPTSDGKGIVHFEGLQRGIYLIFPEKENLFAPFLVMVDKSMECKPKINADEPKPKPEPSPKPPYTADKAKTDLYAAGLAVGFIGLAACVGIPSKKRKR